MMILTKAIQLLFTLSILVLIHELGHFFFARVFRIRVNKFYLFFDIGFAFLRWKPRCSDTEYGIGWLPLGGYCQIDGMVDESLLTDKLRSEPKPWEFRSKPAWQRLLVMLGGVLFNILLAMFIYGAIAFTWGSDHIPMRNIGTNLAYSSVGHQIGLQDGDLPIRLDGRKIQYFEGKLMQDIANAEELVVLRGTEEVTIAVPVDLFEAMLATDSALYQLRVPALIDSVLPTGNAAIAGLQSGDRIMGVNGEMSSDLAVLYPLIQQAKGDSVTLSILRDGLPHTIRMMCEKESGLGIMFAGIPKVFGVVHQKYSLMEAIPAGVSNAYKQLVSYVDQLKYVATPTGVSKLGGLGTMGSLFPGVWDWKAIWSMAAFLSVILAVMNLLPIPGLDGGHIIFLIYEMITGRRPSLKWQTRFQIIGMAFLILLMLYANINDIIRLL